MTLRGCKTTTLPAARHDLIEHGRRHAGSLARPGRGTQYDGMGGAQRRDDLRQDFVDG